jgi:hypothetical protein
MPRWSGRIGALVRRECDDSQRRLDRLGDLFVRQHCKLSAERADDQNHSNKRAPGPAARINHECSTPAQLSLIGCLHRAIEPRRYPRVCAAAASQSAMFEFRATLILHRVVLLHSPSYGDKPMVLLRSNGTDQIAEKAPGPVSLILQSMVRDVRASRKMRRHQLSPPSWRAVGKIAARFKAGG